MCASIRFKCALYNSPLCECVELTLTTVKLAPQNNTEFNRSGGGVRQGQGSVQIKISKTVTLRASAPYVHVHTQTGSGPQGIFSVCSENPSLVQAGFTGLYQL